MRDPSGILPTGSLGPLAVVLWLLQLGLIVHVLRTGRPYWWIWILFVAPLVGGLAYVLVELSPDLRGARGLLALLKPRAWRIADRRRLLEEADTVKNRLALAAELADAGMAAEAHEAAVPCLCGVFRDDARTLVAVARFKAGISAYADALALLARVDTTGDRMLEVDLGLGRGQCLAGLGRIPEAERAYAGVAERCHGEAARAGLALVYEQRGRRGEADAIWADIRAKYRTASPIWRRSERKWYALAKVSGVTSKPASAGQGPNSKPATASGTFGVIGG
jgi:hypothetical protein